MAMPTHTRSNAGFGRSSQRVIISFAAATLLLALLMGWLFVATPLHAAQGRGAPVKAPTAGLTIGEAGARLSPYLPWLLGMDAPRTYLMLVQNNHELRATGGFIAAVGKITLDKGSIVDFNFVDSYQVYSATSTYPPAPLPMQDYMGIPLLVMRDANWSPDLPTTAQVARALYAQDEGRQVDGVFTIDLNAVRHLIGALGSLDVPGAGEPITSDNIEQQVIHFWEKPTGAEQTAADGMNMDWWSQRKDFIPAIAKVALSRIQAGKVNYPALLNAVQAALDDRSIQAWVNEPQVQSVLADARWDGGLHPLKAADYLTVIDTNMGYNKVDQALQRDLAYSVNWPNGSDQPALATVTLTYTHPITTPDPGCDPSPRYGTTYADMVARCYFDYVRVFAPAGSKLVAAHGLTDGTVTSRRGEQGTEEFAGYFVMPPNSQHQVTFSYRLPVQLKPENYRLLLQRQSGTKPLPVTLDINGSGTQMTLDAGWLEWPSPGA